MDVEDIAAAQVQAHLADGFQEGEAFDIADGAADFGDDHIDARGGQAAYALLYLVGYVGDDLDGAALKKPATT
ncbi:unnamed protein product [marine sediment metagenome]|uniref:Uncharacterized protein n=1 Tax=marine sediment metagenome TaxID=412755 RepID=X1MC24_9ZZZZ